MPSITWEVIIDKWALVAADLMSEYGVDVYDHARMRATRWAAGRTWIGGLFSAETRVSQWYQRTYGPKGKGATGGGAGHR